MSRFMRKGITKVYWVDDVADPTALTDDEVLGGIALHDELMEINGFSFANSPIDLPVVKTAFVGNIPGEDKVESSSMVFYERTTDDTNPIYAAILKGASGNVVFFPEGVAAYFSGDGEDGLPAVGDKYELWECVISSKARKYSAGNEAATYEITFSPQSPPVSGVLVAGS